MFSKKEYFLFSIFYFLFSMDGFAQCAMCRAALETEETGMKAEAVNDGIVYLMAFPYLLLLVGGIVIYRIMKGKKKNKA
ncbi:hypothetical protein MG290_12475 [Flavobacterium sp. CBA20B-1]|uniref:hypothetical protein n=1 Tax=unclassified Flavobacterium TaxID=196869 RepID=UPI0022251182|nr:MULTISPECIES: hypothetical protein [unclassified Flavobacterium]WCM41750.1 hypothetical protein MG290_12475 [Flavobacterium sp. CBA20B-1]